MLIERYTQDANDLMRTQFLQNVWHFEDLHKPESAPEYIHRIKCEIKHMASAGEKIVITNNAEDNVDVYLADSPQVIKELDIEHR
jgi:hypothetical protein